jgi:hypothetical protein
MGIGKKDEKISLRYVYEDLDRRDVTRSSLKTVAFSSRMCLSVLQRW